SYLENREPLDRYSVIDPIVAAKAFGELGMRILANPTSALSEQFGYWRDMGELWLRGIERFYLERPTEPVATPAPEDRRFKHDGWVESFAYDFIKQSYLLTAEHIQAAVRNVEGLDPHTKKKVGFYTRQIVDALSPSNFVATNPQVLKATIDSRGENLLRGLSHLLEDLKRGRGRLTVKMTDLDAFRLGENIATTPGKVVYQNELMQLIQYAPNTAEVRKRPLLIVPPCINKYYILDLKPRNSFITWAVDQGHTVFVISWANPDEKLARKTFDDSLLEGPLAALDAIEQATGEGQINAIGYCIGGTLLAVALAYMANTRDRRIVSATFFTSLLDFSEVGEVEVFIDEEQLQLLEDHMARKGYLEGYHMATAFNLLRENELIWSFAVN